MKDTAKNRVMTLAALVFLFATRWVFYEIEIDNRLDTPAFIAECVVFMIVFALCLFRVPRTVATVCLAALCVGMAFFYSREGGRFVDSLLLTASYASPLLFLIDQYAQPDEKDGTVFRIVRAALMLVLASALVAEIVRRSGTNRKIDDAFDFCYAASALTAAVFAFILLHAILSGSKNEQGSAEKNKAFTYASFVFAVAALPLSAAVLAGNGLLSLAHTVVVLWITDLILLRGAAHPQVSAFTCSAAKAVKRFAGDAAPEKQDQSL